jgi:hypothetical protein
VEAVVFEEDTFLVLSADKSIRNSGDHIVTIMTQIIETLPIPPGRIVKKGHNPLRLLAIVHDLNCEPSWREEWVISALNEIFLEVESRRLGSVALPLLGTAYGSLGKNRFVYLLKQTMAQVSFKFLKRLWLITPVGTSRKLIDIFNDHQTPA